MEKISMVLALFRLSKISEQRGNTIIEDRYCHTCTIDSKIGVILDDLSIVADEPKEYIVGFGGVYISNPLYPGGSEPIYMVLL